ncbi:MAG: substrate-binding domain-containing protein [Bryobacteraceae bacterium]
MKKTFALFGKTATAAALLLSMTALASAQPKEIHVLCSNGIKDAVEHSLAAAEKKIGRKIKIEYSASTRFQKAIEEGTEFDLTILTPGIIDALMKSGKLAAGSKTDVASADLAVGMKAGSPKADISSPDAMKKRLLAAKSVTWTDGGAAGPAVMAMLKGLGIDEQMKAKIVLQTVPGRPAESVKEGQNELMMAPVSEIGTVPGMAVLGFFPKEYQKPVVMTAGISAKAKDAEGAKALVAYLTSPAAAKAIKDAGMKQLTK